MARVPFYPPSGVYADSYAKDMRIMKTGKQRLMAAGGLVLLVALPHIPGLNGPYHLRLLIGMGIAVIVALGLNILTGYCGQLNVGQSAFMMVGAFTAGLLNAYWHWPFWASVIPAGLMAAAVGVLFGIPSVRLKGLYLALTTLGAQIILTGSPSTASPSPRRGSASSRFAWGASSSTPRGSSTTWRWSSRW
jgi:branched-chain amino acid transport system permease protein